jgi:hypothetical protein
MKRKIPITLALAGIVAMCILAMSGCVGAARAVQSNSQPRSSKDVPSRFTTVIDHARHNAEMAFKSILIHSLIASASSDPWCLIVGGPQPTGYQQLVDSGALPIILANRYTGDDIVSTKDYSPGDFYIEFPTAESPVSRFWTHLGEQDWEYDAALAKELAATDERRPLSNHPPRPEGADIPSETTNGRTIFEEMSYDQSQIAMGFSCDRAYTRQYFEMPSDDDARARIIVVARAMQEVMRIWEPIPIPLNSVDGFVNYVGRKNPVAWTNPYTGEPMREVPWNKVAYYEPYPNSKVPFSPTDQAPHGGNSPLAGNYSFTNAPCPSFPDNDKNNVYAQFYFYLPNGTIAAYLVRWNLHPSSGPAY